MAVSPPCQYSTGSLSAYPCEGRYKVFLELLSASGTIIVPAETAVAVMSTLAPVLLIKLIRLCVRDGNLAKIYPVLPVPVPDEYADPPLYKLPGLVREKNPEATVCIPLTLAVAFAVNQAMG